MHYTLNIGGNDYPFSILEYERIATTEAKSLKATIHLAGPRLPALGDVVIVTKHIDNVKLEKWRGKVEGVFDLPSEKGSLRIEANDLKRKINYIPVPATGYANTKGSTIFAALRDPSSATDLLIGGTVDTTDPVLDSVDFGKSATVSFMRADAMQIIQMLSDRDVYIERDGKANFVNGAGVDRSPTHVLIHGLNCKLDDEHGFIQDDTRKVKRVTVRAKGVGSIFISGAAQDAGYTTNDKVRQLELPFIVTNATANLAATNALNELNKTIKYAKVEVTAIFMTNYDVFDTVRLQARLPTRIIDENLKIFSIKVRVSGLQEQYEKVDLVLSNFRRAVWAELNSPFAAANANDNLTRLNVGTTYSVSQISSAGGASIIAESTTSISQQIVTDSSETNLHSFVVGSTPNAGIHMEFSAYIISRKDTNDFLEIRYFDGVLHFPSGFIRQIVRFSPRIGKISYVSWHYFLPQNVAGKTITVKVKLPNSNGEIEIVSNGSFSVIGEHTH